MCLEEDDRHDYRHASLIATLYNKFWPDGAWWTAEDVLGKATDREKRKAQARAQSVADKLTTQRMMIAAGRPGDLPDWVKELEANRKKSVN